MCFIKLVRLSLSGTTTICRQGYESTNKVESHQRLHSSRLQSLPCGIKAQALQQLKMWPNSISFSLYLSSFVHILYSLSVFFSRFFRFLSIFFLFLSVFVLFLSILVLFPPLYVYIRPFPSSFCLCSACICLISVSVLSVFVLFLPFSFIFVLFSSFSL